MSTFYRKITIVYGTNCLLILIDLQIKQKQLLKFIANSIIKQLDCVLNLTPENRVLAYYSRFSITNHFTISILNYFRCWKIIILQYYIINIERLVVVDKLKWLILHLVLCILIKKIKDIKTITLVSFWHMCCVAPLQFFQLMQLLM